MDLVTDSDGTQYAIKRFGPAAGSDSFVILGPNERGEWGRILGGFDVERPGGIVDPDTFVASPVCEENLETVDRIGRLFLGCEPEDDA